MTVAPDSDLSRLARSLLRRGRHGALATLRPDSGDPYCSLVDIATHPDNSPILLISRLAVHTRNVLADPRVSLMLQERERGAGDPLAYARIMVAGRAARAEGADAELLRRRYLAAHPSAEAFAGFDDFSFFRISVMNLHVVAGFGRIVDLGAADVLTDLAGAEALVDAEPGAVAHMNADHSDAINLYAARLLGAGTAAPHASWRCVGIDPDGMDLQAGPETLRLDFPRRIVSPSGLREVLKELADRARDGIDGGANSGTGLLSP